MAWGYIIKFIIGGTIFVLMSYFSKSKILFLSGVITFIPVMTLINMGLQIRHMNVEEFRTTEFDGIFGAFGAVVLIFSVFFLTNWLRPVNAVILSAGIYLIYMASCKYLLG
ncbi:GlpM family protein [Sporolactobacillus sp. CPB3-1]|uniref:GlpM family protein n=1 Tax=Sporolactobacillus mangiferae TaxID=2940498 RepID=A0ABT0MAR6_9BACL|nr:GlpM family protein [Sporolactobacillus mangiferae]